MSPRCIPLQDLDPLDPSIGGKAAGLARLMQAGVAVPPGFVVLDATLDSLPADLQDHTRPLGLVAVRSSAMGEDGADASFAGQYDTVLNVDVDGVAEALRACLRSIDTDRARAYREGDTTMAVVVQQMVQPRAAGVVFTADPVSGRRDRIVVDAVHGLGEALVSGEATPDHHLCRPDGSVVQSELATDTPALTDADRHALVEGALAQARHHGHPLDLEWAIDAEGALWWLQARPVTALPRDPTELDIGAPDDIFTRCNVGEMMPGAVTPLTLSTTARAVEVGMQRMYQECGCNTGETEAWRFVGCTQGQLLLNLTGIAADTSHIAGANADNASLAICGRPVDELSEPPRPPLWRQLRATVSYVRALTSGPSRIDALERIHHDLAFHGDGPSTLVAALDAAQETLYEAYRHHLISSAGSGALAAAISGILAEGGTPTAEHQSQVAAVLAGAEDVESADVVRAMSEVVDALKGLPEVPQPLEAAWLEESPAGNAWQALLERHGHRGYRELSMRGVEWSLEPTALLTAIRASVDAESRTAEASEMDARFSRWPLSTFVRWSHTAIRNRESTKSWLVRITLRFRKAYRRLGDLLALDGTLEDADLVYFLTQPELVRLVAGEGALATTAVERRALYARQDALILPDVSVGLPDPLTPSAADGEVLGKPVSCGVYRGPARVVRSLAEAAAVQPGEVLVAPVTDVGWTPWFSVIGALVTDLGSAVSHGAVVAREVGLPAVVNTRVGTATFHTGEMLEVDGNIGVVRRV